MPPQRLFIGLAATAAILAGCSSGPSPHALGDQVGIPPTLFGVTQVGATDFQANLTSTLSGVNTPTGVAWDEVKVDECAGKQNALPNEKDFSMILANGRSANVADDAIGAGGDRFDLNNFNPIPPGQCMAGYLVWDVPVGQRPTTVRFSGGPPVSGDSATAAVITWSLPG